MVFGPVVLTAEDVLDFDLNIGKILENWEVYKALRELIANALDETTLSGTTKGIKIERIGNSWHIRDYGRGLHYSHLIQSENTEKLNNDSVIGRFGVGLKDALATLYRNDIRVKVTSRHGIVTLKESYKSGFQGLVTLHAEIVKNPDVGYEGTDFELEGCSDEDIEKAKSMFVKFSGEELLEKTQYGEVLKRKDSYASIYINGVKVAEEPEFLFSYNITSLTKTLKKSLNRERSNVGRLAYSDRVKGILKECKSIEVIRVLSDALKSMKNHSKNSELSWTDIILFASVQLSKSCEDVLFLSSDDLKTDKDFMSKMRSGITTVVIPSNLLSKIEDLGLLTKNVYMSQAKNNLDVIFTDKNELEDKEKEVYRKTKRILSLVGGALENVKGVRIVEQIYNKGWRQGRNITYYVSAQEELFILRSELESIQKYSIALVSAYVKCIGDLDESSPEFTMNLQAMLGLAISKVIR